MGREKPPSVGHNPTTTIISKVLSSEVVSQVTGFIKRTGISENIPHNFTTKDFHSDLIRGLFVKVDLVQRGRISCLLSVKPAVTNSYGTLHGGAVASVAEIMSIACARTVVGEDKELFLGELSTTYLSAAPRNAELTVDASVIRSGRSLTVIAVEFKVKDTGKLVYTSHATFYNTPVASL